MSLQRSDFDKTMYKEAMRYPWQSSSNQTEYRLFRKITDIGTNALDDVSQLKNVSKFLKRMLTVQKEKFKRSRFMSLLVNNKDCAMRLAGWLVGLRWAGCLGRCQIFIW